VSAVSTELPCAACTSSPRLKLYEPAIDSYPSGFPVQSLAMGNQDLVLDKVTESLVHSSSTSGLLNLHELDACLVTRSNEEIDT
jgi:hypothetical protein